MRYGWRAGFPVGLAVATPLAAAIHDLPTMLSYPFIDGLTAGRTADRIAWTANVKGIRTIWTAAGPDFRPRTVSVAASDDGLELTGLVVAPDGKRLVWVRGGDHDANWEEGGRQPNAASATDQPKLTLWTALGVGGPAVAIGEGDAPALANDGRIAFVRGGELWVGTVAKDGAHRVYDEGKARDLAWSPDGSRLAFVSGRGDHAFVGVYAVAAKTVTWAAPSTGIDGEPVWSPDGGRVAFTRRWNNGGAPEPYRFDVPQPWAIVVANAATGAGQVVWTSPRTLVGSYPGGAELRWAAGERLVFRAEFDGWAHLYALPRKRRRAGPADAGRLHRRERHPRPGRGRRSVNGEYRHHARRRRPAARLSRRPGWRHAGRDHLGAVARIYPRRGGGRAGRAGLGHPAAPGGGSDRRGWPRAFRRRNVAYLPRRVARRPAARRVHRRRRDDRPWPALHDGGTAKKPAVIFVHGGPPRQMLLGWSYMDYYSNAYAVNQALAQRGFVVLSVNYRLGIGYGAPSSTPTRVVPRGRASIRTSSPARNISRRCPASTRRGSVSGADHTGLPDRPRPRPQLRYLQGRGRSSRRPRLIAAARRRSVAGEAVRAGRLARSAPHRLHQLARRHVATWRSPVLLIQGDDDRNVRFNQTIDLARRLDAAHVPYEELVLPNEIHGFLRHSSWLAADAATIEFLTRKLQP